MRHLGRLFPSRYSYYYGFAFAFFSRALSSSSSSIPSVAAFLFPTNTNTSSNNRNRSCPPHLPKATVATTTRSMSNHDEVEKAREAAAANAVAVGTAADEAPPTVFDKILSGEWSSTVVHDDETCFAFRDINPQAPTHIVLIPKKRDGLTQLSKARADQEILLGHLLYVAGQIGQKECPDGFRIVINDGKHGAQSVYHLHLHIMGGRQMQWPPG